MYIFDSRERKNDHIKSYFDRHGIAYRIEKLDVGDYTVEGGKVSVDRKQNLDELSRNLTNKSDRSRFWKEVRMAKEQGIKLVMLVEHGGKIHGISDIATWKSKYSPVSGKKLMEEIFRVHISYSIDFFFCNKRSTARKIIEILNA